MNNIKEPYKNGEIEESLEDFINDPKNNPKNQPRYFFSQAKSYYQALCELYKIVKDLTNAFKTVWDNEQYLLSLIENKNKEDK